MLATGARLRNEISCANAPIFRSETFVCLLCGRDSLAERERDEDVPGVHRYVLLSVH